MEGDWTLPPYISRDLEWDTLVSFCFSGQKPVPLKNVALAGVADAFHASIQRTKLMILMPTHVGDAAKLWQRQADLAELALTGTIIDTDKDHPRQSEINEISVKNIKDEAIARMISLPSMSMDDFNAKFSEMMKRTHHVIATISHSPLGAGFEAILSSAITSTWTTFETMAGDLWETAINIHPDGLGELKGSRKRLLRPEDRADSGLEVESKKSIPLHQILRHRFDLRGAMGTALRGTQHFDSLTGVRVAYGLAFHKKSEEVDKALKEVAFDWLSALRNVIVHRAGIADQTYKKRSEYLTLLPKTEIGKPVLLEGMRVAGLMMSTIVCSRKLLGAVDDWVANN